MCSGKFNASHPLKDSECSITPFPDNSKDETIIVTAIPKITDDFGSINHIGWYGSA